MKYLYCSEVKKRTRKTLVYNSFGFDFDEGSSSWIQKETSWPKTYFPYRRSKQTAALKTGKKSKNIVFFLLRRRICLREKDKF